MNNEDFSKCPYCNSENIEGGAVEVQEDHAAQGCNCLACGKDWIDGYVPSYRCDEDGNPLAATPNTEPASELPVLRATVKYFRGQSGMYCATIYTEDGTKIGRHTSTNKSWMEIDMRDKLDNPDAWEIDYVEIEESERDSE